MRQAAGDAVLCAEIARRLKVPDGVSPVAKQTTPQIWPETSDVALSFSLDGTPEIRVVVHTIVH